MRGSDKDKERKRFYLLPGMGGRLKGFSLDDGAMRHVEAMIQSMTPEERARPHVIDGSRRRRIARGSGTTVQEVNRLLKEFDSVQKMVKLAGKAGRGRRLAAPFQ